MPRSKTQAATYKGLMVRIPVSLLEECKTVALHERRSLNAQLLMIIEEWMKERKDTKSYEPLDTRNG